MTGRRSVGMKALALVLAVLLGPGSLPAVAATKSGPGHRRNRSAQVTGKVLGPDGKPATGATIVLTPLEAHGPGQSAVVAANGSYLVSDLKHGLYEVSLEKDGQAYVGNRILLVAPQKKLKANFQLGTFTSVDKAAGMDPGQKVPGLTATASGVAHLEERTGPSGLAWFRTGKGVAVLIGGAALMVAALIAFGNRGNQATPATTTTTP